LASQRLAKKPEIRPKMAIIPNYCRHFAGHEIRLAPALPPKVGKKYGNEEDAPQ
jgi:hypothetical protein